MYINNLSKWGRSGVRGAGGAGRGVHCIGVVVAGRNNTAMREVLRRLRLGELLAIWMCKFVG